MNGRRVIACRILCLCVATLGCFNLKLDAGPILDPEFGPYKLIRPVGAVVRHGESESPAPAVLYDGTGLSHPNPLRASHGADLDTVWREPIGEHSLPVSVEFDLGGEFLVNEMWLWRIPGDELEAAGIFAFDVVMRDANGEEVGVFETDVTRLKGVGLQPVPRFNAFGECVFLPFPDCVKFVELRIHQNRGDVDWVGLAEVTFAGREKVQAVPEPSRVVLMIGSLALLSFRRRSA